MPNLHTHDDNGSEKSITEDIEKGVIVTPIEDVNVVHPDNPEAVVQASGDRSLVLMDLANCLVGWESADDPENPQYVIERIQPYFQAPLSHSNNRGGIGAGRRNGC